MVDALSYSPLTSLVFPQIAAYALATVAAAALGLATYAAPRDLDDAKAIWGVDTGRLRAGTRAPQDERWAGYV